MRLISVLSLPLLPLSLSFKSVEFVLFIKKAYELKLRLFQCAFPPQFLTVWFSEISSFFIVCPYFSFAIS